MKSYPTKFKSFLWKIVQMGTFQKLQNSIQTLIIILWPVYPIHTNSLFWLIFELLQFCHFPPPNTSIRGKDSQILVDLSFEYLSFSNKWETTIFLLSPLTFLQWPMVVISFTIVCGHWIGVPTLNIHSLVLPLALTPCCWSIGRGSLCSNSTLQCADFWIYHVNHWSLQWELQIIHYNVLRKEISKRKQEEREVIYGEGKTETKLTLIFLTPVVNKT